MRGGRRIARFVSDAPIREAFSVQSARYAEKHRRHDGVDLAVYYHPRTSGTSTGCSTRWRASLDYYQANFGPYQFDHVRIVEYPGYANFAQAFAGTIPYSETYGFIADFRDPEDDRPRHCDTPRTSWRTSTGRIRSSGADMEGSRHAVRDPRQLLRADDAEALRGRIRSAAPCSTCSTAISGGARPGR